MIRELECILDLGFMNMIKLIFVIEQMRILMGDIIFILMKERGYILDLESMNVRERVCM